MISDVKVCKNTVTFLARYKSKNLNYKSRHNLLCLLNIKRADLCPVSSTRSRLSPNLLLAAICSDKLDLDKHQICIKQLIVKLRQGSAEDGPQGERPQSLKPCLELTLKLVVTHPPTTSVLTQFTKNSKKPTQRRPPFSIITNLKLT